VNGRSFFSDLALIILKFVGLHMEKNSANMATLFQAIDSIGRDMQLMPFA
jgi:hypothetical protein